MGGGALIPTSKDYKIRCVLKCPYQHFHTEFDFILIYWVTKQYTCKREG